jgi:hypothetical protein
VARDGDKPRARRLNFAAAAPASTPCSSVRAHGSSSEAEKSDGAMNFNDPTALFLAGIVVALIGAWGKSLIEGLGRTGEKQGAQGETMAGVLSRIGQLESDRAKIADALDRLSRLEEFRIHATPRLDEAERTARALEGMKEQIKTLFNRVDEIPRDVVAELAAKFRVNVRSAANG